MSQRPPLSNDDLIALSAYLDDELSPEEKAVLQARLENDDTLRAELDSLQRTVNLLRDLPTLPAPRDFTLDPAEFGQQPAGDGSADSKVRSMGRVLRFGAILSAAAALLLAFGLIFLLNADDAEDASNEAAFAVETDTPEQIIQLNMTVVAQENPSPTPLPTQAAPDSATSPQPTADADLLATVSGRMATVTLAAVGGNAPLPTATPEAPVNADETSRTGIAGGAGAQPSPTQLNITPTMMVRRPPATATALPSPVAETDLAAEESPAMDAPPAAEADMAEDVAEEAEKAAESDFADDEAFVGEADGEIAASPEVQTFADDDITESAPGLDAAQADDGAAPPEVANDQQDDALGRDQLRAIVDSAYRQVTVLLQQVISWLPDWY
jgi:hypothetical protein